MTDEEYYDEEIGPRLLEVGQLCQDRGLSLCALVEYEKGKTAHTATMQPDACFGQRMATWACKSDGNVDKLMFAVIRYGKEHGHSSIILSQLENA
jgi:hypothetical protein